MPIIHLCVLVEGEYQLLCQTELVYDPNKDFDGRDRSKSTSCPACRGRLPEETPQ